MSIYFGVGDDEELECGVCLEPLDGPTIYGEPLGCVSLPCTHRFHCACIKRSEEAESKNKNGPHCPMCRSPYRLYTSPTDGRVGFRDVVVSPALFQVQFAQQRLHPMHVRMRGTAAQYAHHESTYGQARFTLIHEYQYMLVRENYTSYDVEGSHRQTQPGDNISETRRFNHSVGIITLPSSFVLVLRLAKNNCIMLFVLYYSYARRGLRTFVPRRTGFRVYAANLDDAQQLISISETGQWKAHGTVDSAHLSPAFYATVLRARADLDCHPVQSRQASIPDDTHVYDALTKDPTEIA